MADLIQFTCATCQTRERQERLEYRGAHFAGYDHSVLFSDFGTDEELPPTGQDNWQRAEIPPRAGEKRVVKARYPFTEKPGQNFFCLFQPALAILNGLDCHPDLVLETLMVDARLERVITSDIHSAWLEVEINQVYGLDYALALPIVEESGDLLTQATLFHSSQLVTYHQWIYLDVSTQGDLGRWYMIEKNQRRLACFGQWGFHDGAAYLSNIQISPSTWKLLEENYLGELEK